ncbi:hypothetical protein [Methyloversatilis sp.]|uniref:hypothetical protein n=1 Tax=Methyloversatilis sp. TaxID=2569862 RepID=UPI002734B57C|nr:hypothetical protein [Methyloversatilis sp.]MDP2870485.1 hypothetical protein [Methyloversatilis sp.]MDP3457446.1 hypothetical protein [Methyloversatilis sp.]MDP3576519.1 hypothetical protein [Methyloversatilis sp.]
MRSTPSKGAGEKTCVMSDVSPNASVTLPTDVNTLWMNESGTKCASRRMRNPTMKSRERLNSF